MQQSCWPRNYYLVQTPMNINVDCSQIDRGRIAQFAPSTMKTMVIFFFFFSRLHSAIFVSYLNENDEDKYFMFLFFFVVEKILFPGKTSSFRQEGAKNKKKNNYLFIVSYINISFHKNLPAVLLLNPYAKNTEGSFILLFLRNNSQIKMVL